MDFRPVYTLDTKPAVLSSREEAVEVARSLRPSLEKRSAEAQELRRLPSDNVAELLESGLFGVMKPKHYGGSELGTETMIDVTVELASACASTGWVYMLWAAHMWMQALWPVKAMDEMFANPNTLASSVVTTTGEVTEVDGGYHWEGTGLFSSGVDHCNWLTAAVPVKTKSGEVERTWLLIPREDFEIVDDWHTVGLRGTGSKTILLHDVFVPEYRALKAKLADEGKAPGREVSTHPMYGGISGANFTGAMSAPAVGAARGMVEAFRDRLASKVTVADETNSPYVPEGLGTTMARQAFAGATVDSLHALLISDAMAYSRVPAGEVSAEVKAKCRRDHTFTAQMARRTANLLYEECGGTGLKEGSPIQLKWRDTNAAAAHHGLTWDWQAEAWTKASLGIEHAPGFS